MKHEIPQYEVLEEPCRRGEFKTIKVIMDNRAIYLHSKYDPAGEAEKMVKSLKLAPDTIYTVFGLGAGHHIRALLKRMGNDNRIIVYEPNEHIYNMFFTNESNKDIYRDKGKRVTILKYESSYATKRVLQSVYGEAFSYSKNFMFIMPVYKDIYVRECLEFATVIKDIITVSMVNINTTEMFSDIWFKCYLNNLSFLRKSHSGSKLKDLYKGMPAIVVAAGPSLKKNIELLKEAAGKAVILSVDTAYAPLSKAGIEPDYILSIDSQPKVFRKFQGTDALEKDLVTSYTCASDVIKNFKGRIAACDFTDLFLSARYKELGIELLKLDVGGSVACAALSFAYKIGANPIILVGQDLAYPGGETHIEGTAFYSKNVGSQTVEVMGIDGKMVPSTRVLCTYKMWFEAFFNHYGDRRYIDATEGGAKIEGSEILTLREVIDNICTNTYDISSLKETIFQPENVTATKEQFCEVLSFIEESAKYLEETIDEVDACAEATEKIIKEVETKGFTRPRRITTPYKRIKRLNASLKENEPYVDLIYPLIANERAEATKTNHLIGDDISEEKKLAGDLKRFLNYYRALSEKIKFAVPLIEEAVENEKNLLEAGEYD